MKKNYILMIISVLVLSVFIIMAIGSGTEEGTVERSENGDAEVANGDAVEDEKDEDEVDANSRTNPAGLNESFIVEKDDFLTGKVKYEVELLATEEGDDAWNTVFEANQFNDEPGEDKEYILAKFRVRILETEEDEPYDLSHAKFSVISGSGVEYSDLISVAGLDPSLSADLYEGAEHEGWTYFLVDKDDDAPVAVMDRGRSSEIWFSLRP